MSSRGMSGASVPNISLNDPRSTEEILESWYEASDNYGWDEAYTSSFVEKDLRPPTEDPEITVGGSKPKVKGVSTIIFGQFQFD